MGRKKSDGITLSSASAKIEKTRYSDFSKCTYVVGQTLTRLMLDRNRSKELDENEAWVWIYDPPSAIELQCDGCVRQHKPLNQNCSATIHRRSPCKNPLYIYEFKTNNVMCTMFHLDITEGDKTIKGGILTVIDN